MTRRRRRRRGLAPSRHAVRRLPLPPKGWLAVGRSVGQSVLAPLADAVARAEFRSTPPPPLSSPPLPLLLRCPPGLSPTAACCSGQSGWVGKLRGVSLERTVRGMGCGVERRRSRPCWGHRRGGGAWPSGKVPKGCVTEVERKGRVGEVRGRACPPFAHGDAHA